MPKPDMWPSDGPKHRLDLIDVLVMSATREGGDNTIRVGFPGTRHIEADGVAAVSAAVRGLVQIAGLTGCSVEVSTGGCVGTDHRAMMEAHWAGFTVHTILPANRKLVPDDWQDFSTTWEEGGEYRARNKALVRRVSGLFVVADYPEQHPKSRRSGTWMTWRLGREAMKPMALMIQHDED